MQLSTLPHCFCDLHDDGYILVETCSWFCLGNKLFVFGLTVLLAVDTGGMDRLHSVHCSA